MHGTIFASIQHKHFGAECELQVDMGRTEDDRKRI